MSLALVNTKTATVQETQLLAPNVDDIVKGGRVSAYQAKTHPVLYSTHHYEQFSTTTGALNTGGKAEFTVDTAADYIPEMFLVVKLPGIAGVDQGADGETKSVVRNDDDIKEPFYCEAVGHRIVQYGEMQIGGNRHAITISEYLMFLSECYGSNKPRMEGNRIGYYSSLQEQCERSRHSQMLYINLNFFMQDDRLALCTAAAHIHPIKVMIEFAALEKLIVRPYVESTEGDDGVNDFDGANGWNTGRLKVMLMPDDVEITDAADSTSVELLGIAGQRAIPLPCHIMTRSVYHTKVVSESLSGSGFQTMIPQMQYLQTSVRGQAGVDTPSAPIDIPFTNAVRNLVVIGRTAEAEAINSFMDTSAGPSPNEPTIFRPIVKLMDLKHSGQVRVGHSHEFLENTECIRTFLTEPRHPKTKFTVFSWEAKHDPVNPGSFANYARLRRKTLTLTVFGYAFGTSGESTVNFTVFSESWNTMTYLVGRARLEWSAVGY